MAARSYVIDTNVLVAALRSRNGASFQIIDSLIRGDLQAVATEAVLLEYRDVLGRDSQLSAFWSSPEDVETVVSALASRLRPVPVYFKWRPQLQDVDDERLLECAINAMTADIVTFNKVDFLPAATRFGIDVLSPGELLRLMRAAK